MAAINMARKKISRYEHCRIYENLGLMTEKKHEEVEGRLNKKITSQNSYIIILLKDNLEILT